MSRIILTLALLPFGLLTPILELGPTHVFNPDWPGHARLHEVWQLGTNSALALLCLWLIWGRGNLRLAATIAFIVAISFLASHFASPLYGGTMRHSDGSELTLGGVNSAVAIMLLAALAAGSVLAATFRRASPPGAPGAGQ